MILMLKNLKTFFSNNLSDGIANPGIFTLKATKEKFFKFVKNMKK